MPKSKGVLVGLRDLHYALLTSDDDVGTVYEVPVPIARAIEARISPSVNTDTLYADDGPAEVVTSLGEIGVEVKISDLPLSVHAALLGHTVKDGVMVENAADTAPYLALGFRSIKSNGKYRYVWLYKGKFAPPEQSFQTKADRTTFNTPTLRGAFVKRASDDDWRATGDEDEPEFLPATAANWFAEVYKKSTP